MQFYDRTLSFNMTDNKYLEIISTKTVILCNHYVKNEKIEKKEAVNKVLILGIS